MIYLSHYRDEYRGTYDLSISHVYFEEDDGIVTIYLTPTGTKLSEDGRTEECYYLSMSVDEWNAMLVKGFHEPKPLNG